MTIKHIDKQYTQEPLAVILQDYRETVSNETGGVSLSNSSVQIYINEGIPVFFNHVFAEGDDFLTIMVDDFNSVIEPNFSEDWIVTIITTIRFT